MREQTRHVPEFRLARVGKNVNLLGCCCLLVANAQIIEVPHSEQGHLHRLRLAGRS
jgi:hypothetical protein